MYTTCSWNSYIQKIPSIETLMFIYYKQFKRCYKSITTKIISLFFFKLSIAYNINKPEAIFLCINLLRSLNSVPRIIS